VYPPSLAGSKTAVSFIKTDYHTAATWQTQSKMTAQEKATEATETCSSRARTLPRHEVKLPDFEKVK
jgi:hypothetical protein